MAKFLCRYLQYHIFTKSVRYEISVSRNIALPNVPISTSDKHFDYDVLRSWRPHRTCAADPKSFLAGDPKQTSLHSLEIREEVLRKWNQGPKLDVQKEWVKNAIYY